MNQRTDDTFSSTSETRTSSVTPEIGDLRFSNQHPYYHETQDHRLTKGEQGVGANC